MASPEFTYLGNQAIVTSGRVVVHSYDDYIFHFGKKGVAISTPGTYTMDVGKKTIVNSNRIDLGLNATEPLLLGTRTVTQLGFLLDSLQELCKGLKAMTSTNLGTSLPSIVQTAVVLEEQCGTIKRELNTNCLSTNTFTK